MNGKFPESLRFTADGAIAAEPAGAVPALLRRFTGDGIINLLAARSEVESRVGATGAVPYAPPLEDAVHAEAIPSVAQGNGQDRILAEIDQDGFAFAEDPVDRP